MIQDSVLTAYSSIIKRVRGWILPLLVLIMLGSAYGRTHAVLLSYFSMIELTSVHTFFGWLLSLIWLLFVYDFFFQQFSRREESSDLSLQPYEGRKERTGMTRLVYAVFYLLLFLVCLSGLMQYSQGIFRWQSLQRFQVEIGLTHICVAWLFISSALIRYYLSITRWLMGLLRYLRED
jgi:cytochrome b561